MAEDLDISGYLATQEIAAPLRAAARELDYAHNAVVRSSQYDNAHKAALIAEISGIAAPLRVLIAIMERG